MTLRQAVLGLGLLLAALGAVGLLAGLISPALMLGFWGLLLVLSLLYERFRYKGLDRTMPGPGWTATAERFIDPESGHPVRVYVDAAGERRYVQE